MRVARTKIIIINITKIITITDNYSCMSLQLCRRLSFSTSSGNRWNVEYTPYLSPQSAHVTSRCIAVVFRSLACRTNGVKKKKKKKTKKEKKTALGSQNRDRRRWRRTYEVVDTGRRRRNDRNTTARDWRPVVDLDRPATRYWLLTVRGARDPGTDREN